ncbi:hypothetical protein [Cupriavidus pauculus]|uniref:hypothetical protein n=1 Tax=Cupriavidus pauculus TaxID=82633 RepID=UPI002086A07B|nr:hypothetical protein [Cupriavidus pauculus]GJG98158.1 hypothetical protein CBA19C6_26735 [Cupriavidus pauculus]
MDVSLTAHREEVAVTGIFVGALAAAGATLNGRLKMAMDRVTEYRGFDIHVDLNLASVDTFDVWFQVEGPMSPPGVAAIGKRIKVFGGPYSRRWAYLVAELGGRAAVDVILGPDERAEVESGGQICNDAPQLVNMKC